MKNFLKILAVTTMLTLPVAAHAAHAEHAATMGKENQGGMMNCPMMGDMQKNMGSMMKEMDSMMGSTSDPAMKERMQKMHDQMGSMM